MIKFGEDSPLRKSINYNEDGFLHIHTRGMYGQKVRVELFEKILPASRSYCWVSKTMLLFWIT